MNKISAFLKHSISYLTVIIAILSILFVTFMGAKINASLNEGVRSANALSVAVSLPRSKQIVVCPQFDSNAASLNIFMKTPTSDNENISATDNIEEKETANAIFKSFSAKAKTISGNIYQDETLNGGILTALPLKSGNLRAIALTMGERTDSDAGAYLSKCRPARTKTNFFVPPTTIGHVNTLTLVNPYSNTVKVQVKAWGTGGAIKQTINLILHPAERKAIVLDG